MEETLVPKRPREEAQMEKDLDFEEEYSKRHKPYNHILSLLDLEENEATEDLSPLMTTLQQEITCASNNTSDDTFCCTQLKKMAKTTLQLLEEEENDKEKVMRHLLQASDDELGIPNSGDRLFGFGEDGLIMEMGFLLCVTSCGSLKMSEPTTMLSCNLNSS
ncbi:hypothetical protein E2542_SST05939 [Spatholobus suberectus]|nr:hypothetical protein E2542_SST05939 [Spatholobus suberectus]